MGREDFSQSSQLSTLVGKPTNRYQRLPKNVNTLRSLTEAKSKPNNRYHYSIYPLVQKEYQASYTQLTNLDFYSPIITIKGSAIVSHLIGTTYEDAGVTVDEGSTLISTVSTVDDTKFGIYSVTYTSTDGINPDTTAVRKVKVGLPPDVTINGQNPFNLEKFDVYVDPGITINDSNSFLTSTTSTLNNLAVGTYTVNYTVSNPAFTEVFSRTVRVDDTIPPVITITGGTPYELERFDPYVDEGATVDLGSELTNTDLSNVQNTAIGSFDVVYTAYDGNTTVTATRTVNVVDTVPPVITILGDNPYTLERFDVYTDQGATVDTGSILTTDISAVNNTLTHGSSFEVTYTATDGNTAHDVTQTRTVNIVDTKPPAITLLGDVDPYQIQPAILFQDVDPGFEVDLGTSVSVDYSNVVTTDNSNFDVVYRASDGVNPDAVVIRRVAVADTLSPVVILNGPSVITLERYAEYVEQSVTLDPGSTLVSTITDLDNTTVGSYTVTYLATDNINPDTTNVRTINVVDTTAPIVTLNGASSVTLERYGVFADIDPGVTIDANGTLVSVDISQLNNTTQGTYTVTYNVVDDHNNANVITREVVVEDTVPPVVTLNNESTSYTLERYGDWSAIDPGVTVDAGSFVKEINIDNTIVGLNRPVDYVISDGNTLHDITVTRNITIEDTVPPFAELIGSNNIRVPLNSVWEDVDPGLTNFDAGSSLDYISGFSNTVTDAQFVYYNLTDGVNSNSILRVVTCTLPGGTVNTAVSTTLERFSTYVEPDEAIINITDGYVARIDTSNVDSTAPHGTQQVIVYDLGDDVNNTLVTRTITIQDTTAPTGTVNTAASSTLERFGTYVEPDEAIINMDQSTYVARIDTSNVDSTAPHGTQQVIVYDLGDGVNSNLLLTRTITIQDTTTPTGTVNTAVSSTLERFGTYVEPDEAIINMDQSTYVARIDTSNVDSTAPHGTQQVIVYDLGDGVNSNLLLTRTITIQDTTTPTGTVNTAVSSTLERFGTYVEPDEAIINMDQSTYVARIDTSNVDSTAPHGTQQVIVYDLGDGVNSNLLLTRTITIQDTVAPVITITNDTITGNTLERFDVYSDAGASVDPGSVLTTDLSQVQNTAVGSFNVVYTANDGNTTSTAIRTVTVVDTTPPLITLNGDNPYYVERFSNFVDPFAYADAGSTMLPADLSNVDTSLPYGDSFDVVYSAVDISGSNTAIRTVILDGEQAKIQASDKQASDFFGFSVSISEDGNTAIVAASHDDYYEWV
jgi:hypothetical protein